MSANLIIWMIYHLTNYLRNMPYFPQKLNLTQKNSFKKWQNVMDMWIQKNSQ